MKIFKKLFYRIFFLINFFRNNRQKNLNIQNYTDIKVTHPISAQNVKSIPKIIWLYWEGKMPALVVRCIEKIKELHPDYRVNVLTPANIQKYCTIDFNDPIINTATPQQRADLIRFNLIYQYGGIWLDASTIVYEKLDWIDQLVKQHATEGFAYYRAKNTTQPDFPVIENWLLASIARNPFYQKWFDELYYAIQLTPKIYIQQIKQLNNANEILQSIGRLEYLVAYVACQKIMREHPVSMVFINCDQNAFFYQVTHGWMKERILIDMALNVAPDEKPKLIKLAGKERKILSSHYEAGKYLPNSLLDI